MRTLIALTLFIILGGHSYSQYKVLIDLKLTSEDQVPVEIITPAVSEDSVEYHMPKIVPGTYSISDFGRFVSEFKAFDADGNELEVKSLTDNRWLIGNATALNKITYKVDDTFDSSLPNKIFEPGGTNIEQERDVYVLNTFGFIGYLEGYDKLKYEVEVKHDPKLYGATSMIPEKIDEETDRFTETNYFNLADAPIMYSVPDTTVLTIGGAEILVSVFSPNGALTSEAVMNEVKEILIAQKEYLGGELPIQKYAFLIYLFDSPSNSGAYGALEHSYSSLYFLPEANASLLGQTIRDVSAHEFFHIVTPLNIHAEQIENFNFIEPEMSEHLWLYEGVTEYSANHVQVKYDLISQQAFLDNMRQKMLSSKRYDRDLAFTEMSAEVLDKYENQYPNVYEKGALIGMCLDLQLLISSDGEYNIQQLMQDLSKEYGKNKAFKDNELFDKITELTYPEVGEFLRTYVGGSKRLPFEELLAKVGVVFAEELAMETITFGNVGIAVNDNSQLIISDIREMNAFGDAMGYKEGDILLELQGTPVILEDARKILTEYTENTEAGDKVTVIVGREVKGKLKQVKLKAKAQTVQSSRNDVLEFDPDATELQLKLRKAWLEVN
ncbi:MAG: peptidase M61 [bacterium]|nr:peptidase M61 [bacterium]